MMFTSKCVAWDISFLLESCSCCTEPDSVDSRAGRNVEHRAALAPGSVRGGHTRLDAAEMRSIWRKDMDAARPDCENVAVLVNLHAIGDSLLGFRPGSGIEKDATVGEGPIVPDVVGHPDSGVRVGVADVQGLLVRREADPIGTLDVPGNKRQ